MPSNKTCTYRFNLPSEENEQSNNRNNVGDNSTNQSQQQQATQNLQQQIFRDQIQQQFNNMSNPFAPPQPIPSYSVNNNPDDINGCKGALERFLNRFE